MDVLLIALLLGGIAVADDILNNRLELGAKLADRFSRSTKSHATSRPDRSERLPEPEVTGTRSR